MRQFFYLIIFLAVHGLAFGQKSIVEKLYADTVGNDSASIRILTQEIKRRQKDTLALQLLKYTHVVAYRINESYFTGQSDFRQSEPYSIVDWSTKELSTKTSKPQKLTKEQIQTLLYIYNNPDNFIWAECGTPIPIAGFVFYKKNKIIGYIDIACDFGHTDSNPRILQTKWGALSPQGIKQLVELCKQLDIFHGVNYK